MLIGWCNPNSARVWLEAWRLANNGWTIDLLPTSVVSPNHELFPGKHIFMLVDNDVYDKNQGYSIIVSNRVILFLAAEFGDARAIVLKTKLKVKNAGYP